MTLTEDAEPGWLLPLLLAGAAIGGLLADQIGPSGRINILAPPVLVLVAWNLVVFAVVLIRLVTGRTSDSTVPPRAAARIALGLHLAAALFALTMLASLYARGLAFEYRAGWESTFLGAREVHALLSVVLGPASMASGIALPDATALQRLRFSEGPGENAARWIHLYAWTVLGLVVLPRLLLAARAAWAARRLAPQLGVAGAGSVAVVALPYGFAGAAAHREVLESSLARMLGHPVAMAMLDNLPIGGEDDIGRLASADAGDQPLVLLFPMTATPERETHGAFVAGLRQRWPQRRLIACVDASAFRARLDAQSSAERVAQRCAAWRSVLEAVRGVEFHVVDLARN